VLISSAKVAVIECANFWRFSVWCGLVTFRVYVMKLRFGLSLISFMTRVDNLNVFRMIDCIGMIVIMFVSSCVRRGVISSARMVTQS